MKTSEKKGNLYSIAILLCIVIILISLYIIFMPNDKVVTPSGIEVEQLEIKEGEEITEEQARTLAVKQFKVLREDVKEEELNVIEIQRNQEKYYYVTSINNSLEIKINGGKITRINTMPVKE